MNVVVYANSPTANTGFGTVVREIFLGLLAQGVITRESCSFYGINYFGQPHDLPFRVWPAQVGGAQDPYGKQEFTNYLLQNAWPCDILFVLEDIFHFNTPVMIEDKRVPFLPGLIAAMRGQNGRPPFKVIQYIPIDTEVIYPEWVDYLHEFVDCPVAYTKFGRRVILDVAPELRYKLIQIPHGSSPDQFKPDPKLREEMRKVMGVTPDQPLLINVNRNQPRKDVPSTMAVFKEVLKFHPTAVLYLHMNPFDQAGCNLEAVRHNLRIPSSQVKFPAGYNEGVGFPVNVLNAIYNAADLLVTSAQGGGWELTVTEAMAAGLPAVASRHTCFRELLEDGRGYLCDPDPLPVFTKPDNSLPRYRVDRDAMVTTICRAIDDAPGRAEIARTARNWALNIGWQGTIARSWADVFRRFDPTKIVGGPTSAVNYAFN